MNKIIVLGAGESGVGAALLAKKNNFEVWVSDAGAIKNNYKILLEKHQIAYEEGGHSLSKILEADKIIKSPGIPNHAPVLLKAQEAGISVISEIAFGKHFTKGKIIGITGSNGKTTTTLLTYHILKNSGLDVGLAGNIGNSFCAELADKDHKFWVLELSSFQLDHLEFFKPYIAVLLNITPDHLDRYDYSIEKYAQAKWKIIAGQSEGDHFIYNTDDPITMQYQEIIHDSQAQPHPLSIQDQYIAQNYHLPLQGKHNYFNTQAAIQVASLLNCTREQIQKALNNFQNAPHRLEKIANIANVGFINDSKATNVDAVFYALDSFPKIKNIIWIAGGIDKGNDYTILLPLVREKVKVLVALGKDNSTLLQAFKNTVPIFETRNMPECIQECRKQASEGDIVLLSPACASFDLFNNYEDRGEQFRKEVLKYR